MISCRELVEHLGDYVSNELSPQRRDHVEEHLDHCPACAAYVQSYTVLIQLTRALPPAPLPPTLVQRWTHRI